jgi:trk system potassium uptake protein
MYVVVAGGGHMGTHLVSRLMAEGHEVVVIDVDPKVTQQVFTAHGAVAITGSATDLGVLEEAGLKRADVAVAMTGRDAHNLSFCLLARYLGVPRVLARMLDPKYEVPYRLVGATKVHNEAEILVDSFLVSIDYPELGALMRIGRGDVVAVELVIPVASRLAGLSVAQVVRQPGFPGGCVFVGVERADGQIDVPNGHTMLQGGASVILALARKDLPLLLKAIAPPESPAAAATGEMLDLLRRVAFFSALSEEDLGALSAAARFENRKKGDVIYRRGETTEDLYVIATGTVRLDEPEGQRQLRTPASFGELGAVTGRPRRRTATAITEARLLVVDSRAFRLALVRNPFLALEVAKALPAGTGGPQHG